MDPSTDDGAAGPVDLPYEDGELAAAFGARFGGDDTTDQGTATPVVEDATDDDVDDAQIPVVDGTADTDTEAGTGDDTTDTDDTDAQEPVTYTIGDRQLTQEEADALLQLDTLLSSDAAFRAHLAAYLNQPQGQPAPTPAPTTPQGGTAPDNQYPWAPIDPEYLEHPVVKQLYDISVKQWEYIENLKNTVSTVNEDVAERRRVELETLANNVATSFATEYHLSDKELATLRTKAAELEVVPGLIRKGISAPDAFKQALDMAYWATPEYRTRVIADHAEKQQVVKQKKAKAAAVSGSAGSAARTAPKPVTEQDRRQAMIDELAQGWS